MTRYTVCSWYDWFLTFLPVMSPSHYSVYVQWAPHRCSLRIPKTLLQFGSVRIWSRNPPKASRPPAQKQPVSSTWQLRCLYRVPPPLWTACPSGCCWPHDVRAMTGRSFDAPQRCNTVDQWLALPLCLPLCCGGCKVFIDTLPQYYELDIIFLG